MAPRSVASILVDKSRPLVDDIISVVIRNLCAGQHITVGARCSIKNLSFISYGHYTADSCGEVRLDRDASQGGTYHGLDPMGLFWSYIPAKGQNMHHRMIKTDVMNPYDVTLSVWDRRMNAGDFDKEGQPTSESLCQYHLQRCYMKDGVKRIEMSEGRLKGTLFLPTEVTREQLQRPAILDLMGNAGGIVEYRAAMLASRGFVTLSLGYMGVGEFPSFPDRLDLEYFEDAVDYLAGHDAVLPGHVGAIGLSKGANLCVALASYAKRFKCAVIQGTHNKNLYTDYHYKGHVYPAVRPDPETALTPEGILVLRPVQEDVPDGEEYINPVEQAKDTEFLFIHGADDQVCDVVNQSKMIQRLRKHNLYNFESHTYPGTGHMIEPPFRAICNNSYHPGFKRPILYGGEREPQARAQREIWRLVLDFFHRHLG